MSIHSSRLRSIYVCTCIDFELSHQTHVCCAAAVDAWEKCSRSVENAKPPLDCYVHLLLLLHTLRLTPCLIERRRCDDDALKDFWRNIFLLQEKYPQANWRAGKVLHALNHKLNDLFLFFTFLLSSSFLYISFAIHFDSLCLALFLVIHTSFSQFLLSVQSIFFLVENLFSPLFCTHKFLLFTCSLLGSSPHHETQRLLVRAVVELHYIKKMLNFIRRILGISEWISMKFNMSRSISNIPLTR